MEAYLQLLLVLEKVVKCEVYTIIYYQVVVLLTKVVLNRIAKLSPQLFGHQAIESLSTDRQIVNSNTHLTILILLGTLQFCYLFMKVSFKIDLFCPTKRRGKPLNLTPLPQTVAKFPPFLQMKYGYPRLGTQHPAINKV